MSAVAWTHWDIAFEEAGKCAPDQRLAFTLPTAQFSKALSALANDHGWLAKSDPRYQEACRTGRLEWWDERGRCVVVVREGTDAALAQFAAERRRADFDPPAAPPLPKVGDPGPFKPDPPLEGKTLHPADPRVPGTTYPGKGKKR